MTASYIFISYARKDRAQVVKLTEKLRMMGHQVWFDESLAGGEAWWAEILQQIEQCHIFLFVLSQSSLKSDACMTEKAYAQTLGKPLLPVKIESVGSAMLPVDLSQVQIVDYVGASEEGLLRLVNAIQRSPGPKALPSPPPERPPVPVSYLSQLGLQAREAKTADEQILVVYKLGRIIDNEEEDPEKRAEALLLIDDMSKRHDLFADPEHQIHLIKAKAKPQQVPLPTTPTDPGTPPGPEPRTDPRQAVSAQTGQQPQYQGSTQPVPGTAPKRGFKAQTERRPWLIPVIVCGAVILVALCVLCGKLMGSGE